MVKRLENVRNNKIYCKITAFLFPVCLFVFAMLHIAEGITATDTGYNYGNFVFFDTLDDMWKFSTYLANVTGAFFTALPFGQTMLGLNFYTGLFKALAALAAYFAFVKICRMPKETVFLGEMAALGFCWCPTALLYNYMTYFLFTMGALWIFCAFDKQRKRYFVLAGICLGLNFMVRLPNVVEIALILCVWFGGFLYGKKGKEVFQDTLWCVLGYAGSAGLVLLYIACRYGMQTYIEGIRALFAMTENATSYSTMSMLLDSVKMYLEYTKWFLPLPAIAFGGLVLFGVWKDKYVFVKKAVLPVAMFAYFAVAYHSHMFDFNYRYYSSMFFWGVLFLMTALLLCVYTMFFSGQEKKVRLLASMAVIMILVTPIGSNNHLYSPLNNLFFAAPVVFFIIRHLLYKEKRVMIRGKLEIYTYPFKAVTVCFGLCLIVHSVLFGTNFVFRDGVAGEERSYQVEHNTVLAGMKTTKQNAQNLQGLNDYLYEHKLTEKKVLLYGNVPSLAFYYSLEPAISSTWPDLESFSGDKFIREVDMLEESSLPVVIVDAATKDVLQLDADAISGESNAEKKQKRLQAFLWDNGYEESYVNESFAVYVAERSQEE